MSADFIRTHTRPGRPSLVPEVALQMADDVVALWEALEAGEVDPGSDPPFWAAAWPGGAGPKRSHRLFFLDRARNDYERQVGSAGRQGVQRFQ